MTSSSPPHQTSAPPANYVTPSRIRSAPQLRPDTPTPIHTPSSSTSSDAGILHAWAAEVHGNCVLVPPSQFLDEYLPKQNAPAMPDFSVQAKTEFSTALAQKSVYTPLISALSSFVKPNWKIVDTSDATDTTPLDHNMKPDISIYNDTFIVDPSNLRQTNAMETFIVIKSDGFELVHYHTAMQASQYRTHSFGIYISPHHGHCRLTRHDHSSLIVTESFSMQDTDHLQTFVWRFTHATPAERGIDTTYVHVPADEVPEYVADSQVWKVCVQTKTFFVTIPFTDSNIYPIGRGTRCFIAVEQDTGKTCVLKDTWRLADYHPEGEVYAKLEEGNVPHIAYVLAAADVELETHIAGVFPAEWGSHVGIREQRHYRIVLDVVGKPLVEFDSSYELTCVIRDALKAHEIAYATGVEHRDLSPWNILSVNILDGTSGLLIDWEFSKYTTDKYANAFERTGTKPFLAGRLHNNTNTIRSVGDDLESFLLILLWVAARYVPNKMTPEGRQTILQLFENDVGKQVLLSSPAVVRRLRLSSRPFSNMLGELLSRYVYEEDEEDEDAGRPEALEKHSWMQDIITSALEDHEWKAIKDEAVYQP